MTASQFTGVHKTFIIKQGEDGTPSLNASTTTTPRGLTPSLGYQTPAASAGTLTATGSDASLNAGFASPPIAQPAPTA